MDTPGDTTALTVLYQDADLIAIHKPYGLLVHRTRIDARETRFAVTMLRRQLERQVYPVHRLDKPTSGVLLFALHAEAARAMNTCFSEGRIQKTYIAIVRGYLHEPATIDYPLRTQPDRTMGKYAGTVQRQTAITAYTPLALVELPYAVDRYPTSRYSLLQLVPQTGRTHQLRRHLKHIFHPIIGDKKYGKSTHNRFFAERFGPSRLYLAATELTFEHPITKEPITVVAPLDMHFQAVLEALGWLEAVPGKWFNTDD